MAARRRRGRPGVRGGLLLLGGRGGAASTRRATQAAQRGEREVDQAGGDARWRRGRALGIHTVPASQAPSRRAQAVDGVEVRQRRARCRGSARVACLSIAGMVPPMATVGGSSEGAAAKSSLGSARAVSEKAGATREEARRRGPPAPRGRRARRGPRRARWPRRERAAAARDRRGRRRARRPAARPPMKVASTMACACPLLPSTSASTLDHTTS